MEIWAVQLTRTFHWGSSSLQLHRPVRQGPRGASRHLPLLLSLSPSLGVIFNHGKVDITELTIFTICKSTFH